MLQLSMLLAIVLLLIGFILLIKGADWLVEGAASVAHRLKISDIVIGLTVIAFGTSAPELIVNIVSAMHGNADLVIGNVVGSDLTNILLVLGIAATLFPLVVKHNTAWKEIPLAVLSVFILIILMNDQFLDGVYPSSLSRIDGIILLSFMGIFLYYTFTIAEREKNALAPIKLHSLRWALSLMLFGLVSLALGGNWVVANSVYIASALGLRQSLIGLTIIAVGTSLPELVTSVVAARRRQVDIAIGNVVGSNIFNVFFILGLTVLIHPITFSAHTIINVWVALVASILLFVMMIVDKRKTIERWQGVLFVTLYFGYIASLVIQEVAH